MLWLRLFFLSSFLISVWFYLQMKDGAFYQIGSWLLLLWGYFSLIGLLLTLGRARRVVKFLARGYYHLRIYDLNANIQALEQRKELAQCSGDSRLESFMRAYIKQAEVKRDYFRHRLIELL
jgi:UPF0716 family protein affecting phage T7 exclusion